MASKNKWNKVAEWGANKLQTTLTRNRKKLRRNAVEYPVKTMCYVGLEVGLWTNPAAGFRAKIGDMVMELQVEIPELILLALGTKNNKSKVICNPKKLLKKHRDMQQYTRVTNETLDFTKPIRSNSLRKFSTVIFLGSDNSIEDILEANVVDMSQDDIFIEKKLLVKVHKK